MEEDGTRGYMTAFSNFQDISFDELPIMDGQESRRGEGGQLRKYQQGWPLSREEGEQHKPFDVNLSLHGKKDIDKFLEEDKEGEISLWE